jgi:hypothetical protein
MEEKEEEEMIMDEKMAFFIGNVIYYFHIFLFPWLCVFFSIFI